MHGDKIGVQFIRTKTQIVYISRRRTTPYNKNNRPTKVNDNCKCNSSNKKINANTRRTSLSGPHGIDIHAAAAAAAVTVESAIKSAARRRRYNYSYYCSAVSKWHPARVDVSGRVDWRMTGMADEV